MFGVAANCVNCKILSSQIFLNEKEERICATCMQKEYNKQCEDNVVIQHKIVVLEQKISVYNTILEQIRNYTQLVKND